jgi:Na+/H+ antiporter NhaD/arsenite permease-like protein
MQAAALTGGPFLALAAIVAAGLVADRLGAFRLLGRLIIPSRCSRIVVAGAVLAYTALLSGLVNLDVAVVVAIPVALGVAGRTGLPAGRLVLAAAMTANATSFLWPTSNLTTLLVVSRSPLSPTDYATRSWISWVLVTAVTVCGLSVFVERGRRDDAAATGGRHIRGAAQTLAGLLPLYVAASAIRALLGAVPLQLGSGMLRAAGVTAVVAAAVNNLPAAAAVAPSGTRAAWVAVLALAIGPNLLVTGSVATLIARQLARSQMASLPSLMFTLVGIAAVPVQMLVALVGLHVTGAV